MMKTLMMVVFMDFIVGLNSPTVENVSLLLTMDI